MKLCLLTLPISGESNRKELIKSTVACKFSSWGDSLPLIGLCGVFDGVNGDKLSVWLTGLVEPSIIPVSSSVVLRPAIP